MQEEENATGKGHQTEDGIGHEWAGSFRECGFSQRTQDDRLGRSTE